MIKARVKGNTKESEKEIRISRAKEIKEVSKVKVISRIKVVKGTRDTREIVKAGPKVEHSFATLAGEKGTRATAAGRMLQKLEWRQQGKVKRLRLGVFGPWRWR